MNLSLNDRVARLNDVLVSVNLLNWDARVMMPAGGAETRGHQIATLMGIAREMILDPPMGEASEAVLASDTSDLDRRAAQAVQEARTHHARIPAALLRRQAEQSITAGAVWTEARRTGDFALFQPHLQIIVDLAREKAQALGYDDHPYDPMADVFEPGATAAQLTRLFDQLRDGIRPILDAALARPAPRSDFLFRDYPIDRQQAFCAYIAEALGYDMRRGRLDTAVHPFEISMTRNDVRITSRWNPNYLPMSIFGTIHEAGHALYEMGAAPALTRGAHTTDMIGLYAVAGTSFGTHESQSRLLENHIGRTPAFWTVHYGRLRDTFPEQLGDVSETEFVAAINRVSPGPTRVEADELTYDLHVMLRVKIEMALMDGTLKVADVPEAWNAAMRDDLGLEVPDNGAGCLQDVHWSHGYIGSFPTYTVGNSTAAQIMAHLDATQPAVRAGVTVGNYVPLYTQLGDLVWKHGRSRSRAEILGGIGAEAYDPTAYLTYLQGKFAG